MYPYRFRQGVHGIGIGAGDMAVEQPTTLPVDSHYGPRYNVRGDLAPLSQGGYAKLGQDFVPVSLLANAVYAAGTLALQALADFERANQ